MTEQPEDRLSARLHGTRRLTRDRHVWFTYIAACFPGWTVAVLVTVALHRLADIAAWAAVVVVLAWIGTDLAMFYRLRRYYTPEPAARRIVEETGTAVSPLSPRGFVRVHGELWQATVAEPHQIIPEGAGIRVCDIDGLHLLVEPDSSPASASGGERRQPRPARPGQS